MKTRMQVETEKDLHANTHDLVIRLKMPRRALEEMSQFEREMIVQVIRDSRRTNAAILAYIADFTAKLDGEDDHFQADRTVSADLVGGRALDLGDEKEKL